MFNHYRQVQFLTYHDFMASSNDLAEVSWFDYKQYNQYTVQHDTKRVSYAHQGCNYLNKNIVT